MSKSPLEYLPKDPHLMVVQGRIPRSLVKEVKEFMHKHSLTWTDMLVAAFTKYLDDVNNESIK